MYPGWIFLLVSDPGEAHTVGLIHPVSLKRDSLSAYSNCYLCAGFGNPAAAEFKVNFDLWVLIFY